MRDKSTNKVRDERKMGFEVTVQLAEQFIYS